MGRLKMTKTSVTEATTVRPEDYAGSPVHYSVATGDHATLTKLISALPKLSDPTRIQTESESLAEEAVAKQISAVIDSRDNPLRDTPLHVAVRLNDAAAAVAIAAAGANIHLRNAAGWNCFMEALLRRRQEIARILLHHEQVTSWHASWRRHPRELAVFRRMPDFYMEISFSFESIIPLVSKVAPSDTYQIWKRAGNLRADFSMAGYEGMKIKRANRSILFLNDDIDRDDVEQGSLIVVKHDKKKIEIHLGLTPKKMAPTPYSEAEISRRCSQGLQVRPGIDISKAELVGCKNWRRQEKTEKVGQWKARVCELHNVVINFRTRTLNSKDSTDDQIRTTESELSINLRPMVWLTEGFPLKTEELQHLVNVLSKKLKSVGRLREVLRTKFPPGTFPVKVAIPVVPTVRVVITFTKFVELQPIDEEFYTPPSSPTHLEEKNSRSHWLKGKKKSDSSCEDTMDLFAIPKGYSLIRKDK